MVYKKMYYSLFNEITDAVEILRNATQLSEISMAVEILENAQFKSEDDFLDNENIEALNENCRKKIAISVNDILR